MAAIAERKLIVNADDLGISAGVNRGIVEAHAAGAVTSASLLANGLALRDAVRLLRETTTLRVGLHLNFTAGMPVSQPEDIPTLCDGRTRQFYPLSRLVGRALTGRLDPSHVFAECRAQLDRLRKMGVAVRHIDSHRHVHALPVIWKAVTRVARHEEIRAIRVPAEPVLRRGLPGRRSVVATSLRAALAFALRGRADAELYRADHFRGLALLGARRPDFQRRLLALLDELEPGTTELMVHPGYSDGTLAMWDSYTTGRELELAALCSREVRERLTRGDLLLVA